MIALVKCYFDSASMYWRKLGRGKVEMPSPQIFFLPNNSFFWGGSTGLMRGKYRYLDESGGKGCVCINGWLETIVFLLLNSS